MDQYDRGSWRRRVSEKLIRQLEVRALPAPPECDTVTRHCLDVSCQIVDNICLPSAHFPIYIPIDTTPREDPYRNFLSERREIKPGKRP
jgi:hypothetical protein